MCSKFVTDVAWCRSIGVTEDIIATSSESNCIQVWKRDENGKLAQKEKIETGMPAWNINWSPSGTLLAANCGEDKTHVYKEDANQKW